MKLVWISGWAYDPSIWAPLFAPLGGAWSVDVLDPLDLLADTTRVDQVLDNDAPAVLGGWSLGAMLALEWACLNPAPPIPLMLVSATCAFRARPGADYGMPRARLRALRLALKRDRAAALASFYALTEASAAAAPLPCVSHTNRSTEALLAGLDYLEHADVREHVRNLRAPITLLHGEDDALIPAEAGRDVKRHAPQAEIVLVPRAAHNVPFTHPNQLLTCLRSFQNNAL